MAKYLANLDLVKNELQNARVQNLGSAPGTPVEGQIYYDTGTDILYYRNASAWVAANGADLLASNNTWTGTNAFNNAITGNNTINLTGTGTSSVNGVFSGTALSASGLTGAVSASRYVGATASAAPSSGTFVTGDFAIGQTGSVFICTAGGSPGTWVTLTSAGTIYNQTIKANNGSAITARATMNFINGTFTTATAVDNASQSDIKFDVNIATPTIALGSAAAAGSATSLIRSDATIAAFDATSPSTQAIGDSAVVGSAAFAARRDHKHAMPAFATPAIVLGTAAAAGSAVTLLRSDATIVAFDATVPTTIAVADAASAGAAAVAARRDHTHGMAAFGSVTAQTSFGASSGNGAATTLARSDHVHGTPTHDGAAHSAVSISSLSAPTGSVAWGSQKITGLADGTASSDAATFGQLQALQGGLSWKDAVRVISLSNATLATAYENGDTVDGVTLATGDRILLAGQTTASERGIYTVNASGAPTRAVDADASGEIEVGTVVPIQAGTVGANTFYYCTATTANPWVPGSSGSTWSFMFTITATQAGAGLTASGNVLAVGAGTGITVNADDVAINTAVVVRKYAVDVGDNSSTSIVVTHSLSTRDVTVALYLNSGTYEEVMCDVEHTSTSTVTLKFAVAPTSAQYRCVVHA